MLIYVEENISSFPVSRRVRLAMKKTAQLTKVGQREDPFRKGTVVKVDPRKGSSERILRKDPRGTYQHQ